MLVLSIPYVNVQAECAPYDCTHADDYCEKDYNMLCTDDRTCCVAAGKRIECNEKLCSCLRTNYTAKYNEVRKQ